jgi:hypothetical protein
VTIPAKPFEGKIQLQALELACQGLAQRARLLSRAGSVKDPTRLRRIDRMVAEALEILEEEIMSYREADRTMGAGLLLRMLSDKEGPEPGSSAVRRSFDQPPSPAHSLSLRGEGKSIPTDGTARLLSGPPLVVEHLAATGKLAVIVIDDSIPCDMVIRGICFACREVCPDVEVAS